MKISKKFTWVLLTFCLIFLGGVNAVSAAEITGYKSATVRWNGVVEADSYNIYYKEKYESSFSHSVRDLSKDSREYTIGYLKEKGNYVYKLCGVKADKTELWCSQVLNLGKGTVAAVYKVEAKNETVAVVTPNVITGHNKATVTWADNDKAEHYYVYYKKVGEANWTHSVFNMGHGVTSTTIQYLDNVGYEYQVVSLDGNYKPIEWSAVMRLR